MPSPIDNLVFALARLPGFGRKSAERAALALVRRRELADDLSHAIEVARDSVCCCSLCGGLTVRDANPCGICSDATRDHSSICVVEDPGDILAFEKSGFFKGLYHSLNGKISASRGTGPDDIRIKELLDRAKDPALKEIVLATGTDLEGDATAAHICELLKRFPNLKVTRIAYGLPVDSGIGYSDPVTLQRAFQGRR